MVEHLLAKEGVESSNLFIRSLDNPVTMPVAGFVIFETMLWIRVSVANG